MAQSALRLGPSRLIHVVSADPHFGAMVERILAGSPHTVRRQTKIPRTTPTDILILDHGADAPASVAPSEAPIVVIADFDAPSTVEILGKNPGLNHVVARNGPFLPRLLEGTLSKLLAQTPGAFADHLTHGSRIEAQTLIASGARQGAVDRVVALANQTGAFSELATLAGTVASELLMNAFFDAPVDAATLEGKHKDRPRHEPVTLAPDEAVTFAFGRDDDMLALSVRDPFGSLTRATLLANLQRAGAFGSAQIRMQTQGAGVGLYIVLSSVTALEVRVTPNVATEITALFALTKRYRDFEQLGRSVSLFFPQTGDGT